MRTIILKNLVRFFPYESVHASDPIISIVDTNKEWHSAIINLLSKYEPEEYFNCSPGYFHLEIDNKITLELDLKYSRLYITYWDNNIYISDHFTILSNNHKYCTVKHI